MIRSMRLIAIAIGVLLPLAAAAQQDRERAQLRQLQQQLQKLQQDNAALAKEKTDLQSKSQEAEKLKGESAAARKDATQLRGSVAVTKKELDATRGDLTVVKDLLTKANAEIATLKAELVKREVAQQESTSAATAARAKFDAESGALAAQLKQQTGRAEFAEAKHAGTMQFADRMINLYERDRLRLCEPITGLWKVGAENKIQALRDELFELRLVPPQPGAAATKEVTSQK